MDENYTLYDMANDESTLELIKIPPIPDILEEFLSVDVFGDDILEIFSPDCFLVFHNLRVI